MPKITWDDSFSVGVEDMDSQHRKFIEIINQLHEVLMQGSTEDLIKVTEKTLAAMYDYARYHFGSEEKLMHEIGFPGVAAHKQHHDNFLERIRDRQAAIRDDRTVLNTELMKDLLGWLEGHILNEDKTYARFVKST